jgi:hypothetical protein
MSSVTRGWTFNFKSNLVIIKKGSFIDILNVLFISYIIEQTFD